MPEISTAGQGKTDKKRCILSPSTKSREPQIKYRAVVWCGTAICFGQSVSNSGKAGGGGRSTDAIAIRRRSVRFCGVSRLGVLFFHRDVLMSARVCAWDQSEKRISFARQVKNKSTRMPQHSRSGFEPKRRVQGKTGRRRNLHADGQLDPAQVERVYEKYCTGLDRIACEQSDYCEFHPTGSVWHPVGCSRAEGAQMTERFMRSRPYWQLIK